jgi:hypothetical protein
MYIPYNDGCHMDIISLVIGFAIGVIGLGLAIEIGLLTNVKIRRC